MASTWRTLTASLSAGALLLTVFGCSPVDSTSSSSAQPSTTSSPSATTTPEPEPSQTAEEQQSTADMIGQAPEGAQDNALTVLNTLAVKGRAPKTGYSRDQFGAAWADVDHNGCDTRNDILTLSIHQKFAVQLVFTGARITGEGNPGSAVIAHIAKYHHLYVDCRTPASRNIIHFTIENSTRIIPRTEHCLYGTIQLLSWIAREFLMKLILIKRLEAFYHFLHIFAV